VWADSRWTPLEEMEQAVQNALLQAFARLAPTASTKKLWTCWTDPSNISSHYEQCIGHGLNAKSGKTFADKHRACEWCVQRGRLCALIHEGSSSNFVGILPCSKALR
jgi:hypothetical protein